MIAGLHPLVQSLLGTFFTWGLTAAGAGLVFIWSGGKVGTRTPNNSAGAAGWYSYCTDDPMFYVISVPRLKALF